MVVDFGYPTFLGWGSLFHLGTASFVVISTTSFAKSLQGWAVDSLAFYFKIDPKTENRTGFLVKAALQLGWKQESKLGAGEATQSQVSQSHRATMSQPGLPAPRNAQALTVLLNGT